jgi:hypothetical protein
MDRLLGETRAEHDVGAATLAITFERIARYRGTEEQKVVEMRKLAFGAASPDVVDPGCRGPPDLRERRLVERRRRARGHVERDFAGVA